MDEYSGTDWLNEVLEEVGLQKFHSKLTNDLQLTKLSHFDFVSEDDLIQLGLSKPAAKRLLAAIKKRKSFVTAIKNKIVNKLIPLSSSTSSSTTTTQGSSTSTSSKSNKFFDPFNCGSAQHDNKKQHQEELGVVPRLINSQEIQLKEQIGYGVHGFVKKGLWTAPNGRIIEVAVKILRKDNSQQPDVTYSDLFQEIKIMRNISHPNIIKLYGVVLGSPLMMVTELAPFGNLRDWLRKENGSTSISQLVNFGIQIAAGMMYLGSRRVVHRDLAARNIFISHGRKILIGDLGLTRVLPAAEDHYVMSEKTKIPYPWCAPESLRSKQFSRASDVYMFGVTLWEMFSFGKEPWNGLNLNEILENISTQTKRLPCPKACPTMVYETMLQCWNTEPSLRPKFSTLYQYLSTSYPLEVRSTQHISELTTKRLNGHLMPDDIKNEPYETTTLPKLVDNLEITTTTITQQNSSYRNVLNCNVDDRILVIDGQPEKYWWKGQNQRTFEIGWFPLCSTRWMAPKKGSNYISKPLKNSFIHAGHCGKDGNWGSPRFIDYRNLKNSSPSNRIESDERGFVTMASNFILPKSKTKSRLSKLFGINDATTNQSTNLSTTISSTTCVLPHSYEKFTNDISQAALKQMQQERNSTESTDATSSSIIRSQSGEKVADEGPLLIDLSEDISLPNYNVDFNIDNNTSSIMNNNSFPNQIESLIDVEEGTIFNILEGKVPLQRHNSDLGLNKTLEDQSMDNNYRLSWAGSWNTGTFDGGSSGNIYSNYYCPQDAASTSNTNDQQIVAPPPDNDNRYYSAVANED